MGRDCALIRILTRDVLNIILANVRPFLYRHLCKFTHIQLRASWCIASMWAVQCHLCKPAYTLRRLRSHRPLPLNQVTLIHSYLYKLADPQWRPRSHRSLLRLVTQSTSIKSHLCELADSLRWLWGLGAVLRSFTHCVLLKGHLGVFTDHIRWLGALSWRYSRFCVFWGQRRSSDWFTAERSLLSSLL
jgi:hypothetical protein